MMVTVYQSFTDTKTNDVFKTEFKIFGFDTEMSTILPVKTINTFL